MRDGKREHWKERESARERKKETGRERCERDGREEKENREKREGATTPPLPAHRGPGWPPGRSRSPAAPCPGWGGHPQKKEREKKGFWVGDGEE